MKTTNIMRRGAVLLTLVLIGASCGGGESGGADEGPRQIEIAMTEFAFEPVSVSVAPGEMVEFVVTNDGSIEHEFRLTNQAGIDEHLASGHEGHEDETASDAQDANLITVMPGETKTLTVTIPDDDSVTKIACLIPGHYEAGMVADLALSA